MPCGSTQQPFSTLRMVLRLGYTKSIGSDQFGYPDPQPYSPTYNCYLVF